MGNEAATGGDFRYFYKYPGYSSSANPGYYVNASGYCMLHGQFFGYWTCPACSSVPAKQTVTISPVSTEAAIAAMVKAFTDIINNLQEQVAERDRQIERLQDQST